MKIGKWGLEKSDNPLNGFNFVQWHQRDLFFQRHDMVAGIYNPQMLQIKILYGNVHGFGDFRGFTEADG